MTRYVSTRGAAPELDFAAAAIAGLAADGGLYVPKAWPRFSEAEIGAWRGQPYRVIAQHVLGALVGDALPAADLRILIDKGLAHFSDPDITPLRQLDERIWIMELFHGPTLAFKDLALQFLGRLFDHLLGHNGQRATVVGATSGDTGSAAIAGCAGCRNLDVFILYPHNRPSEIQRRQMTTVAAPNVHALAVEGSFDDCQAIVKGMFNDAALRAEMNLVAVNSINWARIAAQIVYYFYAATRLGGPATAPGQVAVGDGLARRLKLRPGSLLKVAGRPLRVTGTYHTGILFEDQGAVVPLREAQRIARDHRAPPPDPQHRDIVAERLQRGPRGVDEGGVGGAARQRLEPERS